MHLELNSSVLSTGKSASFAFRTRDENGTLLLVGASTRDHVSVSLKRGFVKVAAKQGSGMLLTLCLSGRNM